MKKFIAFAMVCAFALAFVSCGGSQKAEEAAAKAKADSVRMADSVAMVQADMEAKAQAAADSVAKAVATADSIANAAAAKPKKK